MITHDKYNNNSEAKRQNVCLKQIFVCCETKTVKSLAAYYLLKSAFQKSRLYNYKSRMDEFSKIVGVSKMTLYAYFKDLKEQELIYEHNNNLLLLSTKKLKKAYRDRRKTVIHISPKDTLREIEAKLFAKVIEYHGGRIAHCEALRRFNNRTKYKKELAENGFKPSISLRNVAKLLNISTNRANKVIGLLNNLGVLKTENQKPELLKIRDKKKQNKLRPIEVPDNAPEFIDGKAGHYFVCKKHLYVVFGMKYEFLEYPLNIKTITYRKFIKARKTGQYNF